MTQPATAMEQAGDGGLVLELASVADSFPQWGTYLKYRDRLLRQFWPTESLLASAIYTIVIRNAAFSWTLEGTPRTVEQTQAMLQSSDFGKGYRNMMVKVGTDLFTQDNGAFIEIIRSSDSPNAPAISLAHLDSYRCFRTGDPEVPVRYLDRQGALHFMKWYQVVTLSEFPSPVETMFDVQLCAVSRVLRMAQLLRDIMVYRREKVSGNNPNSIFLASGVGSKQITDALAQHRQHQTETGMTRYIIPLIVGSLDPSAAVKVEQIPLKSLPDGFDEETALRWYITQLAMGLGADYQDFAPLPGRALGSSTQSLVLHMKSRGRGPAMWMGMVEQAMNFHGIVPANVTFRFDEQDVEADTEQAELEKTTSDTLKSYVEVGILTPAAAQQVLLDRGFISQEVFDSLNQEDLTPKIVVQDDEPVDDSTSDHIGGIQTAERDLPEAFAIQERLDFEARMENDMASMLNRNLRRAKSSMGVKSRFIATKEEPPDILNDPDFWDEFQDDAVNTMMPLARDAALEAANMNLNLGLGVNMDLVNQEVLDFTARYTTEWWGELSATTERHLRSAITAWQETGLGRRGLQDLAKAIEPTFGRARAKRIAVTEVTQLFDEGNRLAHNSAGIQQEEWQTVEDSEVEEICKGLNGKRFPTNSGPRPVKDTHIGCRCSRLPVGQDGNLIGGA